MSVTFTASLIPSQAETFVASCGCEEATALAARHSTYESAHAAAQQHNAAAIRSALPGCAMPGICPDYDLYALEVVADPAPEVDLHQSNGLRTLELLGLRHAQGDGIGHSEGQLLDSAGEASPGDFLGRVLLALALTPWDAGRDFVSDESERWWTGGRSEGRLQDILRDLQDLAAGCQHRGRTVVWY